MGKKNTESFRLIILNIGEGNLELIKEKIICFVSLKTPVVLITPVYTTAYFASLSNTITIISIKKAYPPVSLFSLGMQSLIRSFRVIYILRQITKPNDILYSISSVPDAILAPYIVKICNSHVAWSCVFDNDITLKKPNRPVTFRDILSFILYKISLFMLRKSNIIFAISSNLKEILIQNNFKPDWITVTGNAIEKTAINQIHYKKNKRFDAIFIGRLHEDKGIFDIVKVVRQVTGKFPHFTVAIAGSGDDRTGLKLHNAIAEYGLEKNIHMLGYVSGTKKYNLLGNTKMFIFPSYYESFGVAVLEAAAAGLPVISYNLSVYKYLFSYTDSIYFAPLGNHRKLKLAIYSVLNKKTEIKPNRRILESKLFSFHNLSQTEYKAFSKLGESKK